MDVCFKFYQEIGRLPSRENLTLPMMSSTTLNNNNSNNNVPRIPQRDSRPKSQGYNTSNHVDVVRTPTRDSTDYSSLPSMKNR